MAAPPGDDPAGAGMRMLPAGGVTAPALRGLSRFADTRGVAAGREFLLDYDVIEAFCVAGLAGRASSARGTCRPALYRLAEAAHGPAGQRATPFAGARAPAPYSPGERAELAAVAAAQRDRVKRSPALGDGGVRHRGGAAARRAGGAGRQRRHPARPPGLCQCQRAGRAGGAGHRGLCWPRLAAGPKRGQWFRVPARAGGRSDKNFVASFARGLAADPAAPALPVRRARSTFICGHLAAGTPVGVLLAVTGIAEAGSLARYARHVAGVSSSKGVLRARCRAERTP